MTEHTDERKAREQKVIDARKASEQRARERQVAVKKGADKNYAARARKKGKCVCALLLVALDLRLLRYELFTGTDFRQEAAIRAFKVRAFHRDVLKEPTVKHTPPSFKSLMDPVEMARLHMTQANFSTWNEHQHAISTACGYPLTDTVVQFSENPMCYVCPFHENEPVLRFHPAAAHSISTGPVKAIWPGALGWYGQEGRVYH